MTTYRVTAGRYIWWRATIDVTADSADDACREAIALIDDGAAPTLARAGLSPTFVDTISLGAGVGAKLVAVPARYTDAAALGIAEGDDDAHELAERIARNAIEQSESGHG